MPRKNRGRYEGCVHQRKSDGRWTAAVSGGYGPDGRRRRRWVYGRTKQEVIDKLKELPGNPAADAGRLTVADYLTQWLASVKPSLALSTAKRYEQVNATYLIPHLGAVKLAKLTPLHVQGLLSTLEAAGTSARCQQMAAIQIGTACRAAVRLGMLAANPASAIRKPRPVETEFTVWTAEQAQSFLKSTKCDRLHALYALALGTGMRQGELLGLWWKDIDFREGTVSVRRSLEELDGAVRSKAPKTKSSRRRIDLGPSLLATLNQHRKAAVAAGLYGPARPVFAQLNGEYLRKSNLVNRSFKPLVKAADLPPLRFHDLRHCHATLLLSQGVNIKVVAERLGHADTATTLRTYAHVLPSLQAEAAAKIDRLLG